MKPSELIADPERWTRGWYAKTATGQDVNACDGAACRWCAIGALRRCIPDPIARWKVLESACEAARRIYQVQHLDQLNDGPDGHAKVLRVLREIGQ